MVRLLYVLVALMISIVSFAQEKAPEVSDDYVSVSAWDSIAFNPMDNDWCMEGHEMKILYISSSSKGSREYDDSLIYYKPWLYAAGEDKMLYYVLDLDNGLLSDTGYIHVDIINDGYVQLDINNVNAQMGVFGHYLRNPDGAGGLEVPRGSGRYTIRNFTPWIGCYPSVGERYLIAEFDRTQRHDFFPGPVYADSTNHSNDYFWTKAWKVSAEEVELHKTYLDDPMYTIPEDLEAWPAFYDPWGEIEKLAPFEDVNQNGTYDPQHGDYPTIRGHQAIYFVTNDNRAPTTIFYAYNFRFEIHGMAYAWNCDNDSVFDNTVYLHYEIINRSPRDYEAISLGFFTDFAIGNPEDDYMGCDTNLNLFFCYNGDDFDEAADNSQELSYGASPPAQGIVILNDTLKSFIQVLDESIPDYLLNQYYRNLQGLWFDDTHLSYGGNGYGGLIPTNFIFPGDPSDPQAWSEVSAQLDPGHRNTLANIGSFDLPVGDTLVLDLAFVFARDYQGTNLTSVDLLKERVETVQWFYDQDSIPCVAPWAGQEEYQDQKTPYLIVPNPATSEIMLEGNKKNEYNYSIHRLTGQLVKNGRVFPQEKINISGLEKGCYLVRFSNLVENFTLRVIKI